MNADTLARMTALYARLVRLTELVKKPSAAERAEVYLLRVQLEDMGFDFN